MPWVFYIGRNRGTYMVSRSVKLGLRSLYTLKFLLFFYVSVNIGVTAIAVKFIHQASHW